MFCVWSLLLCVVTIQGGYCLQLFLHCQNMACIQAYSDETLTQLQQNKSCITINSNSSIHVDYQLSQEIIHDYMDGPYSIITLKGSPFSFPTETINKYRNEVYKPIKNFVVDWVHKRVYIALEFTNVLSGSMIKSDQILQLDDIISANDVSSVTGGLRNWLTFLEVAIDPYRRYLFVLATGRQDLSSGTEMIVVRSDLNGKQLIKIISKPLLNGHCRFYVDVNKMKLYVSIEEKIYIYNYEGEIQNELHLPYSAMSFVVFRGSLYFSVPQDTYSTTSVQNKVYEVDIDRIKAPIEIKNVYQLDTRESCKIRILDARVQRRLENGKYLCDRTDCPELCDVDSSGDKCVCFKTKAKTVDGIGCYTCGQSNLTSLILQPTIVNGQTSYPGNFPWHAVIYKISNREQVCGGTLISSRAVLTAAHCVTLHCISCVPSKIKPEELRVALGKTNRSWNITEPYETRRNVSDIIVHDNYMGASTNYANDIALVFMDSEVSINPHVMPACLDYNLNQLPPHETLTGYVCGFGFTKDCGRSCSNYSNTLLYTIGTSINLDDCLRALNAKDFSVFHTLTSDKMCMGNGTVSPVQMGDSGGGLTVVHQGLHYVTGVVSVKLVKYDNKLRLKYSFGAFTNVSMLMDWIKNNIIQE